MLVSHWVMNAWVTAAEFSDASSADCSQSVNRDVNRLTVNRITGYITRDWFQLMVTDTWKSNCDLRHLAVGRDTSMDRKQIMIKSVHRSHCRWLMSIKVPVVTAPNPQWALSTDDSGSLSQRVAIAKVRCRKSPRDTCTTVKLKLTLTQVLTLTDTGGAVLTLMLGYRSLYITIAIATFAIADLCDSGLSPHGHSFRPTPPMSHPLSDTGPCTGRPAHLMSATETRLALLKYWSLQRLVSLLMRCPSPNLIATRLQRHATLCSGGLRMPTTIEILHVSRSSICLFRPPPHSRSDNFWQHRWKRWPVFKRL